MCVSVLFIYFVCIHSQKHCIHTQAAAPSQTRAERQIVRQCDRNKCVHRHTNIITYTSTQLSTTYMHTECPRHTEKSIDTQTVAHSQISRQTERRQTDRQKGIDTYVHRHIGTPWHWQSHRQTQAQTQTQRHRLVTQTQRYSQAQCV